MNKAATGVGLLMGVWIAGGLVGCGSSASDGVDKRSSVTVTEGALAVSDLELGGLSGAPVTFGATLAGDTIPVIAHGTKTDLSTVWTIDARHESARALPPLPQEGWIVEGHAVASADWTVVTGILCPDPPGNDDIGPVCKGGKGTPSILALETGGSHWKSLRLTNPDSQLPRPDSIVGDELVLALAAVQGGWEFGTIDLGADRLVVKSTGRAPAPARCTAAQAPVMTFNSADRPTVATAPAAGDRPAVESRLPSSIELVASLPPDINCMSARTYLYAPGTNTQDSRTSGDGAGGIGAEPLATDPARQTTGPAAPTPDRIVRLDTTAEQAIELEVDAARVSSLVAGDSFVGLVEGQHLLLVDAAGSPIGEVEMPPGTTAAATGTRIVLVSLGKGSKLTSVELVRPLP